MERSDGDWPIASGYSDEGDQEETSKETYAEPFSTEWTNEKHSLYLKSIEASFVDQLYSNTGFPVFETPRKPSTEPKLHLRSSVRPTAGQSKTLRGSYWQKFIVGKSDLLPDGKNISYDILSNPWIRHYMQSERHHVSSVCPGKVAALEQDINSRGKAALPHRFSRSLKLSNAGPSNSHNPVFTDNDTEASGQNFDNEDVMEEKSSSLRSHQQVKTRAPMKDSTNHYQTLDTVLAPNVPFKNSRQAKITASENMTGFLGFFIASPSLSSQSPTLSNFTKLGHSRLWFNSYKTGISIFRRDATT